MTVFDKESRDRLLKRLGSVEDVSRMTQAEIEQGYARFLNPVLASVIRLIGMNRHFVEARGAHLWDRQNRKYLDFFSGFGSLNLGHEPPEILAALREVESRPNLLQSAMSPYAARLAEYLSEVTPGNLNRSYFCSSGTEAVEAALKLARIATGRQVLLAADGAYHGKTFGALSVSGREKYRKPFEPLVPRTEQIPYDDAQKLEARLKKRDVAAFIVEPVQGENGVIVPHTGYLKRVEELCRQYGTLMIADEVQTGMGRTGRLFACDHEDVVPDILCLSKSLGGGVMPLGAVVTNDVVWKRAYGGFETGLLHSSTFGGNTRACACGIAMIHALLSEDRIAQAEETGAYIKAGLKRLQSRHPILLDVRGKGLMIGITLARLKGKAALTEGALTIWVARQLVKRHGILAAFTLNNYDVLRIAPPLVITRQEAEIFLNAMDAILLSASRLKAWGLVSHASA